jgi:hypothetical protein
VVLTRAGRPTAWTCRICVAMRTCVGYVTDRVVRAIVRRAVKVDEDACRDLIDRTSQQNGAGGRVLAEEVVERVARRGALQGMLTGVASIPPFGLVMAIVDTRRMTELRAMMTAAVATAAQPTFFSGPEWQDEVLDVMTGQQGHDGADVAEVAKRAGRVFARDFVSRQGRRLTQRWMNRWLAKRVAKRFLTIRLVPLAGGAVGAAWNYIELRRDGERIVRHYYPTKP